MRGVPICIGPSFLARIEAGSIGQTFFYGQPFESCQPVPVVVRAIVRLAAVSRSSELRGERGSPFFPSEMALLRKSDGK